MNRNEFEKAYANRSNLTWAAAPESSEGKIIAWSEKALIFAISAEFSPLIERNFDEIHFKDGYVSPKYGGYPAECFAGTYKDTPITVMHLGITPGAHGGAYMDMALERLRPGPVREVIVVGECTSLQESVKPGDYVIPLSSIRLDDIHLAYYPPDIPAMADTELSHDIIAVAQAEDLRIHTGVSLSCSAGAGVFDRALTGMAYTYYQMGVLANTVEASSAYLLGQSMGIQVTSMWLVADSLFETLTTLRQPPRFGWEQGWEPLVRVALDTLVSFAPEGS